MGVVSSAADGNAKSVPWNTLQKHLMIFPNNAFTTLQSKKKNKIIPIVSNLLTMSNWAQVMNAREMARRKECT